MRLINADDLVNKIVFYTKIPIPYKERVEDAIQDMPTVDAVEVIRCENCQKRDDKWEDWEEGKVLYWCDIMDGCVKADDYCSYAERRAGEADET